jgi:hypothetical protein
MVPLSNNLNFGNTTLKQRDAEAKEKTLMLGKRCVVVGM